MSSNKKNTGKKSSGKVPQQPQQPVVPKAPDPWYKGQPIGATGRQVGETAVTTMPQTQHSPETEIKVNRLKPGILNPITNRQPNTASFSFPGSNNRMAEISGDPRLSDTTVATVASNTIKRALMEFSARKAQKKVQNTPSGNEGFQDLQSLAEKKRLRADQFSKAVDDSFSTMVTGKRAEVAQQAAQSSLFLMSGAEKFSKQAKQNSEGDFKEVLASKFEQQKTLTPYGPKQSEFIKRMEEMAPEMRGSMYFGVEAQDKILSSGGLFAKHTRQGLSMGSESKTTESDERKLGNQDHVFFYLEHKNTPMRNSRFAAESTKSGLVEAREVGEGETIASGTRRISFPLPSLMQQGTWAMKQDFLSPESIGKELPVNENFVATSERDPNKAAAHFMRQMAISALDMPDLKGKNAKVEELLKLNNQQLSETVFHKYLRPQLMVPSVVNLNTRGAILDMPAQDAIKKE